MLLDGERSRTISDFGIRSPREAGISNLIMKTLNKLITLPLILLSLILIRPVYSDIKLNEVLIEPDNYKTVKSNRVGCFFHCSTCNKNKKELSE